MELPLFLVLGQPADDELQPVTVQTLAAAEDEDSAGETQELGQLAGDEQHGLAVRGQALERRVERAADPDHDGANNLLEFLAGTDPTNALSYLKIDSITAGGRPARRAT